jgi:hypothetical protein
MRWAEIRRHHLNPPRTEMAEAPNISAKITGDASGLLAELTKATAGLKEFSQGSLTGVSGLTSVFSNLKAPLMALGGLLGAGGFLKSSVSATKEWVVEVNKLQRVMGGTSEQATAWAVAIHKANGSVDDFLPVLTKMSKTINADEDAFKRLGVSTRDAQGHLKPAQEVVLDTFEALQKMKGGFDKNVESQRIFGRGFADLQKFMAINKEKLEEARAEAERLNIVVGPDWQKSVKEFRAADKDLELSMKALKIQIGKEVMPAMTALNQEMAESGPVAAQALGGALYWVMQTTYALREQLEKLITYMVGAWDNLWIRVSTAGRMAAKAIKGDWAGAEKEMDEGLKRLQKVADDNAAIYKAIEDTYTGKTLGIMGLGPKKASDKDGADAGSKPTKDRNQFAEEMNRLRQDGLRYLQDELLATKEAAELDKMRLDYERDLETIKDKAKAQGWSASQRAQAERQAALNASDAWTSITRKYTLEREKMETELQAKLVAQEEGGLTQRLETVRKTFVQIREEATKLGKDAGFFNIIAGAEQEAKRRAFIDQVKADLAALKTEMAQTAEAMGRALTMGERLEILNRFSRQRGTKSAAAEQYKDENNIGKAGIGGLTAGLKEFASNGALTWEDWKRLGLDGINSVTNAFAKGIAGLISGTMSLRDALKSIWQDITQAIIQAVSQIIAKFLVINALRLAMGGGALGFGSFVGLPMAASNMAANIAGASAAVASYRSAGASYAAGAGSYAQPVSVDLRGAVIAGESAESARLIGDLVQRHLDARNRRMA